MSVSQVPMLPLAKKIIREEFKVTGQSVNDAKFKIN